MKSHFCRKKVIILSPNTGYQGWNSQNAGQNSKREGPDQTASSESVWSVSVLFV